jgi:TPR repeat protein
MPKTQEEAKQNFMKRVKVNDPGALREMGAESYKQRNFECALEYLTKAAALGDMMAHYNLANMYDKGAGVDKDKKKATHHFEVAAIGGHDGARYNLGVNEWDVGRNERAMKHFIIAANLGHDGALEMVKKGFRKEDVSKEDYASSLRGHQAAVDATKSQQREEADAAILKRWE